MTTLEGTLWCLRPVTDADADRLVAIQAEPSVARWLGAPERGHHRLTIAPVVANTAAIRAYGRVGFRPVGVMRQNWRGPDGGWHDGLLMDLRAGELS